MGKQILIDILVVITLPILIIGVYFLGFRTNDPTIIASPPVLGASAAEDPGVKTKQALDTLKGLSLDGSLFTDPAYTSLKPFAVGIPSASTSRKYPFTPPPIIEERIRQSKLGHNFSKDTLGTTDKADTSNTSFTSKIDQLKKQSTK